MRMILAGCLLAGAAVASEPVIGPDGFGKLRIGMSERQAARALGVPLLVGGEGRNADCYHVQPARGPVALAIMLQKNRVVRVSNYGDEGPMRSDHGIRIGDSEAVVLRAYATPPQRSLHAYGDGVHDVYLTWWRKDGRGVRYEITGGKVTAMHGGSDAIELVEGCS